MLFVCKHLTFLQLWLFYEVSIVGGFLACAIHSVELYPNFILDSWLFVGTGGLDQPWLSRHIQEVAGVGASELFALQPVSHIALLLSHWCVSSGRHSSRFDDRGVWVIAALSLEAWGKTVVVAVGLIRVGERLAYLWVKVIQICLVDVVIRKNLTFYLARRIWNQVETFELNVLHLNQVKWFRQLAF
jgi:hypothetical protein